LTFDEILIVALLSLNVYCMHLPANAT